MMTTKDLKALVAKYPDAINYNEVLKELFKDYCAAKGEAAHKVFRQLFDLIDEIHICSPRFYRERNDKLAEEDIPAFLEKQVAGEYHCHFEYEDWESGNREADISEYFNTAKECYEEALNIIDKYKELVH